MRRTVKPTRSRLWHASSAVMLAGALTFAGDAVAHGQDEHEAPASAVQLAPRGEAQAGGIEAVAVAAPDRRLIVYLDREATNERVTDAVVEVDADGLLLKLRDRGDGVYVADDWTASPGRNRLTIAYRLPEGAGKIEVQLDAPLPRPVAAPLPAASRLDDTNMTLVGAATGAVYLMAMSLFVWRSRRIRVFAR